MPAYSFVQYLGAGTTGPFVVPFTFLSRAHIGVRVDGASVAFVWSGASAVTLAAPAPAGSVVDIRRVTPIAAPIVDFTDGSVLTEADLDGAQLQGLYAAQERADAEAAALRLDAVGAFAAGARRITDLATPVAASDAATKAYVDAITGADHTAAAAASAAAASGSASAAAASAATAEAAAALLADGDKGDIVVSGGVWSIEAGAVGAAELADDAVTAAKIAAGAVGTDELADDAVTAAKIAAGAVGTDELADGSVTAAKLAAAATPVFTQSYTSSEQTFVANSTIQLAHGLGTRPKLIQYDLKCVTAEYNWVIGDLIHFPGGAYDVYYEARFNVWSDATNLWLGSDLRLGYVINKTTWVYSLLTPANWRIIVRAYA